MVLCISYELLLFTIKYSETYNGLCLVGLCIQNELV